MSIKLLACDLFRTCFKMKGVATREEMDAYMKAIQYRVLPETIQPWQQWHPPKSWEKLEPFDDVRRGINRLREAGFMVVTLSNAPLGFTARLLKNAGVFFDAITPLEMIQTYKPNREAYEHLIGVYGYDPSEIMMVTANKDFGDLEGAGSLGMHAVWLDRDEFSSVGQIKTFIDLAEALNC
jgi:2-haloalkanoic acid dehalogenase type II